jgi:hypothetical protein
MTKGVEISPFTVLLGEQEKTGNKFSKPGKKYLESQYVESHQVPEVELKSLKELDRVNTDQRFMEEVNMGFLQEDRTGCPTEYSPTKQVVRTYYAFKNGVMYTYWENVEKKLSKQDKKELEERVKRNRALLEEQRKREEEMAEEEMQEINAIEDLAREFKETEAYNLFKNEKDSSKKNSLIKIFLKDKGVFLDYSEITLLKSFVELEE